MELFVVIALLGVFVVGIYETVIVGIRAVDDAGDRARLRQQLATAVDRFTREVSMSKVVDTAKASEFKFDADFDGDGDSEDAEANILYQVSNTDVLERKQGSNTAIPLVEGVDTLTFAYRDSDDNDLTPAVTGGRKAGIRIVQITITATQGDETITMDDAVYLRNM